MSSAPPLTVRRCGHDVHIVGTAAGPVGGDELELDLFAGEATDLSVRSTAAQLVHPGPRENWSTLRVRAHVAEGASLNYRPEPTILIDGSVLQSCADITLAAHGRLLWSECVVLGRHREVGGSASLRLHIEIAGCPILRNHIRIGPAFADADGPAGTSGHRAVGAVIAMGIEGAVARAEAVLRESEIAASIRAGSLRIAVTTLPESGAYLVGLGAQPHQLQRAIERVADELSPA